MDRMRGAVVVPIHMPTQGLTFVEPSPGDVFAGRYRIEKRCGAGGMGVVYRVQDERLGQRCAIKLLPRELSCTRQAVLRLEREASLTRSLDAPNIVRVYDLGVDGDDVFLVMEYLDGPNLEDEVAARGRLPLDEALSIARQVAAGLTAAHRCENPVIHRDVKPSNVMFTAGRRAVKLTDFGIAYVLKETATRVTGRDMWETSGYTLAYAAPEQISGSHRPSAKSDQYSLAALVYEMLAGEPPFGGPELRRKILDAPVLPIDDVPPHVNDALRRGMAKSPGDRHDDCRAFVAALETSGRTIDVSCPAEHGAERGGADSWPPLEPVAGQEWVNGTGMRLVWIPPGKFQMGSPEDDPEAFSDEKPRHLVTLTKGFWLGKYPVTQDEWQAVMGANPEFFKGPRRPVETVTWDECQEFCRKLSGLECGLTYRLPTEAEWEYACRAGTTTPRYGDVDLVAWHSGNSGGESHDVGQMQGNRWGLHDMLGNVWEWCQDLFSSYTDRAVTDPCSGVGTERVLRGGSWYYYAEACRSAYRLGNVPDSRLDNYGLRLVCVRPRTP